MLNFLAKEIVNKISGNALKILIIIIAKIQTADQKIALSLSVLEQAAALSDNAVVAAIRELENRGLISVDRADRRVSKYALPSPVFGAFFGAKTAPDRKTSA
ncbi:MAG: hypothetical protein LBO72_05895 [Helicobacteraceae bacterium]|jgi:hypothetical protein|nr:hypothetical protein [Helicobacteraceae bacterium]